MLVLPASEPPLRACQRLATAAELFPTGQPPLSLREVLEPLLSLRQQLRRVLLTCVAKVKCNQRKRLIAAIHVSSPVRRQVMWPGSPLLRTCGTGPAACATHGPALVSAGCCASPARQARPQQSLPAAEHPLQRLQHPGSSADPVLCPAGPHDACSLRSRACSSDLLYLHAQEAQPSCGSICEHPHWPQSCLTPTR